MRAAVHPNHQETAGFATAPAPDLTAPRSVHAVRDLLLDRLTQGAYSLGSMLPTAQTLAAELGLHRNTVAKAYRMLADLGLVSIKQGRGTYVVAQPEAANHRPLETHVVSSLSAAMRQARRIGIPEHELRQTIERELANVYRPPQQQAIYVECNAGDIEAGIAEIEAMTGVRLHPLLLDQLEADPAKAVAASNLVFTSLIHIKEVTDCLEPVRPDLRIIGVYTQPDEDAMAQIARIPSGSHVGIIVSSADGARRFENQINTVAHVATQALVLPDAQEIRHLAQEADIIVCNRSWSGRIRSLDLPIPVIELGFHISRQSALRIAEHLIPRTDPQSLSSLIA